MRLRALLLPAVLAWPAGCTVGPGYVPAEHVPLVP